jgi:hypothetical protein
MASKKVFCDLGTTWSLLADSILPNEPKFSGSKMRVEWVDGKTVKVFQLVVNGLGSL